VYLEVIEICLVNTSTVDTISKLFNLLKGMNISSDRSSLSIRLTQYQVEPVYLTINANEGVKCCRVGPWKCFSELKFDTTLF